MWGVRVRVGVLISGVMATRALPCRRVGVHGCVCLRGGVGVIASRPMRLRVPWLL